MFPREANEGFQQQVVNDLLKHRVIIDTKMDPVFCLGNLNRFEPTAAFSMTMDSGSAQPSMKVTAGMRDTGNAVSKGYGAWVRMDDVLRLMIALKDQSS